MLSPMNPLASSILGGAIAGVIVAFVSPRFAHLVWKKQKLRDQQILIAERFARISANFIVLTHMTSPDWNAAQFGTDKMLDNFSAIQEQESLLVLIWCLFKRKDTLDAVLRLKQGLRGLSTAPDRRRSEEEIRMLYKLRVDLLSKLFGEAFDLTDDLLKRKAAGDAAQ